MPYTRTWRSLDRREGPVAPRLRLLDLVHQRHPDQLGSRHAESLGETPTPLRQVFPELYGKGDPGHSVYSISGT
jgi:hypothetical protein